MLLFDIKKFSKYLFACAVFLTLTAAPSRAILAIDEFDDYDDTTYEKVNPSIKENEEENQAKSDENNPNAINLQIEKTEISEAITGKKKRLFEDINKPTGNFTDIFKKAGYTFEAGPIKNQKIRYFYHGGNLFTARSDKDLSNTSVFTANEVQFETLFADNKTYLKAGFDFSKNTKYENRFFEKFSFLFLEHEFDKKHNVMLGEMRIPNGIEGRMPSTFLKVLSRSQIARTFGNGFSNGIRTTGNHKYLEYDMGIYDGSRSFAHCFSGQETAALVSVKPLEKFDGKYGKLKVGGSIDVGDGKNAFSVVGGHAIYNYKKFYADFEYQYANGYAGAYYNQGRSHGLYTTVSYFVTPKLELVARYDFLQNLNTENVSREYTAGATWHVNKKVKFMLNYIYAMTDTSAIPSHKIFIGADILSTYLMDLL